MVVSKRFKAQQRAGAMSFMWYLRSRDYDKTNQDGGAKKTKCVSSNDRTHSSINDTVTF